MYFCKGYLIRYGFFFIFLIKVYQICNVTVKESFKLIIVVSSDNHFSNYL